MNQAVFKPGIQFESNTIYQADRPVYDITPADTVNTSGYGYTGLDRELATGFFLKDLENVTIDLGGATLMFHGRIAPFILSRCRNVTLKNFSIDYDRPFFSQGRMVEITREKIVLRWDDGFPVEMVDGRPCAVAPNWKQFLDQDHMLWQPFDENSAAPGYNTGFILATLGTAEGKNLPAALFHFKPVVRPDGLWELYGPVPETWRAGQILAVTHEPRDKNSILAEYSSNITVERVRLLHGASMGFVGMFSRDITLRRFDMYLDARSRGVVTVNADSVHCFHCTGKVLIEECIFENMLDDAINIHGNYNRVAALDGDTLQIEVIAAGLENIRWYQPGDAIVLHKGNTIEPRGEYTIREVEYPGPRRIRIRLNEPIQGIAAGDVVESTAMPEITVRRCISGKNRPRGFLLSSGARTLIEDCVFSNCSCAIHFTGDTTYWYESGPVRDVTIRHCHFHNWGYCCDAKYAIMATPQVEVTETSPCYHRGIVIEDNVFEGFSSGLLYLCRTEQVRFRNNRYIRSSRYPAYDAETVHLEACGKCDIEL